MVLGMVSQGPYGIVGLPVTRQRRPPPEGLFNTIAVITTAICKVQIPPILPTPTWQGRGNIQTLDLV